MRFATSDSASRYLSRPFQLRMLSFITMIGLGMMLFHWVLSERPNAQQSAKKDSRSLSKSAFAIRDDRTTGRTLKSGEFISSVSGRDTFEQPVERNDEWLNDHASHGDDWARDSISLAREEARRNIRFDKTFLRTVKDNTVGVRRDEADAYFRLLDHTRRVSPTDMDRAALPEVLHINLMTEPARYRGEPITIKGDLWRLYEFQASSNKYGLDTLYEAWIFTADSGTHPYRVVCTSPPRGVAPGNNLRKAVTVTGFFFKCEGYASEGGMHVAPTLLAPRLAQFRPASAVPPTGSIVPYMLATSFAVGLALIVTLMAFAIGDRRFELESRQRARDRAHATFDRVLATETPPVDETLRRLSAQHIAEDARQRALVEGADHGRLSEQMLYGRDKYATVDRPDGLPERKLAPVPVPAIPKDELASNTALSGSLIHDWTVRQSIPPQPTPPKQSPPGLATSFVSSSATSSETRVVNPTDGDSKLAEYEREVERMNARRGRTTAHSLATPFVSRTIVADRLAAENDLARDRDAHVRNLQGTVEYNRTLLERETLERLERERLERERLDRLRADQVRLERERLERERLERERLERDRLEKERLDRDRSDRNRLERERLERERLERERLERERTDREREDRIRLDRERAERERLERERLDRDRQASTFVSSVATSSQSGLSDHDRTILNRLNRSGVGSTESDQFERERLERERLDRERYERERLERERRDRERLARIESGDELDPADEALLTDEQRREWQSRRQRRGGWGWPRRRSQTDETATDRTIDNSRDAAERLIESSVSDDLLDELDDGLVSDSSGDDAANEADADSSTSSTGKKKSGWAAYNERRARKNRRRQR